MQSWTRWIRPALYFNAIAMGVVALVGFIYPAARLAADIADPALRGPGVPDAAWRLFSSLTPRYATWANARVGSGTAGDLSIANISGTEWPLFGSAFYLWSVELLQEAWENGDHTLAIEPKVLARDAIVAASELVVDPRHAAWVKRHWGDDYLHRENAFYRMLVIGALTSRARLLRDGVHLDLLRDQVETLVAELDASKSGLLDDYPGQCYPGDVMAALMCIQRADAVLGTDHRRMLQRALRGFTGPNATRYGLPPSAADARSGWPMPIARGCANSYMGLTAPELWPEQAKTWFARHDELFWQERFLTAAYREFPKDITDKDWWTDVDAGPVFGGIGVSASAFGVGAARKNGRFDRAYPLAAQMLAIRWELPGGMLALPRMMSDASDAPLLGEAAILWQLSIQPQRGFPLVTGGALPGSVYIALGALLATGGWLISKAVRQILQIHRTPMLQVRAPRFQLIVWALCTSITAFALMTNRPGVALVFFLLGRLLPRVVATKSTEQTA